MHFLPLAAVFLLTAVVVVPLFRRLGLGAVLGYLAAGMLLGPSGLGAMAWLGGEIAPTLEIAEFGVVVLLFLIGLELEPRRLWVWRKPGFGLGGAQVLATAAVAGSVCLLLGLTWQPALLVGLALAMSSTALVLSSLSERAQLAEPHGRDAFAVLLFQDLAVIPLLALLPLLGGGAGDSVGGWLALKGLGAVLVIIVAGRLLVRPALQMVARHGSREVFTAAALLLVVAASLLMHAMGLTMSLGAFLAGVLLADSEFRHELEADIEPFKGLLLGLFFMAVGMSANLHLLLQQPLLVMGLAALLMGGKFVVLLVIAMLSGREAQRSERLSMSLSQGGEFAFVLFSAAAGLGILAAGEVELLVLVVTMSMLLAPLAFALQDRVVEPWMAGRVEPEFDSIDDPGNPVIIAGFGRIGQIVARVLRMSGISFTALEASYQQVDFVRKFGSKVYYGDASRLDLLNAAHAAEARLFVLAIDDIEASLRTAEVVRRHFPDLPIVARARNRFHYFRLRDLGIRWIFRETFPSGLDMARQSLLQAGISPSVAERAITLFRSHDEEQLEAQYAFHQDEARLAQTTQEAAQQLRELFETDIAGKADVATTSRDENEESRGEAPQARG